MAPRTQTTVKFDNETHRIIGELQTSLGCTRSEVVRRAVMAYYTLYEEAGRGSGFEIVRDGARTPLLIPEIYAMSKRKMSTQ